jgi:WD40 repeat protein
LGKEQTVHVWDVATGKLLHILRHQLRERPLFSRYALAFSADGRLLASSAADRAVRLWDVATGSELRHWSEPGRADALAFSPDAKVLAAGVNQYLYLLDVNTGASRRTELVTAVSALQFSPDGKALVWGNYREQVAPDGRTLGWANCIGFVHWWDVATGKELRRLDGSLVAASADGKWLAIRQGEAILLWDMVADTEARKLPFQGVSRPNAQRERLVGSFSADGGTLVVPDGGRIRILDTRTGQERHVVTGHSDDVVFVAFSPDGRRLLSAGDRSVRFWDPRTGKELDELHGPAYALCGASLSADGKTLAAGTQLSVTHLWNLEAGKELRQLTVDIPAAHPAPALAPDGKTVAIFGGARLPLGIQLFEVASGKELRHFGPGTAAWEFAFLPDGSALAGLGASLDLYDPQSGKRLVTLVESYNGYSRKTGMAFSPDSRLVATGYPDRAHGKLSPLDTVSLWETTSGKLLAQFRGHEGLVAAFAFSHDGRVVASGGWDGTVRLWDLATGRELRKFEGHRGGVLSLAFSPDDTLLASGGSDTSVLVWDVAELTTKRPLSEVRLGHAELERAWNDLGADSGEVAYRALWQFAAGGKPAAAFLKEQLSADPPDERRVKQLIADLDAEQFEVRDRAMRELTNLGVQAQPLLQKALERPPSAEAQRRLETLLAKLPPAGVGPAGVELRHLRAMQALEYAGTAEARQVLQALADRGPETPAAGRRRRRCSAWHGGSPDAPPAGFAGGPERAAGLVPAVRTAGASPARSKTAGASPARSKTAGASPARSKTAGASPAARCTRPPAALGEIVPRLDEGGALAPVEHTFLPELLHGIEHDLVDVAPAPVLARLGGLHDGVAGRVEVLGGVLVPGGVATADVAARQAEPEVHPAIPGRQALLAALRVGRHRPDFLDVRTGLRGHGGAPSEVAARRGLLTSP